MGQCKSRQPQAWVEGVPAEVKRLWDLRTRKFDPEADSEAGRLLRSYWRTMLPTSAFLRTGKPWTSIGFQGEDPVTDVRAGGLLSIQCLEYFTTFYTDGARQMLVDLRRIEYSEEHTEHFYPFSTTAIVICSLICDCIRISNGMRGPVSEAELDLLLSRSPRVSMMALLARGSTRVGFCDLFSLAFTRFHSRFLREQAGYMMSRKLAEEVVAELELRAKTCCTIDSLRDMYFTDDSVVKKLLVSAGGESLGWRLARGVVNAHHAQKLRSHEGVIETLTKLRTGGADEKNIHRELQWDGKGYNSNCFTDVTDL